LERKIALKQLVTPEFDIAICQTDKPALKLPHASLDNFGEENFLQTVGYTKSSLKALQLARLIDLLSSLQSFNPSL